MAETLLFSVAGKLLGELSSLALQELGLLWGVKNEIEKLQNTVSTIKAVLLDAEEKQTNNHEIRDWLGKLEVALYEADDLLDDFSTEALRRKIMTQDDYKMAKKVRIFFSSSNQLAFRFKMGHKLKEIQEKLNDIAADRTKFHFTELQERVEKKMVSRDFVPVKNVIGREDDKNAIIELLLNSNNVQEDVSTVSIVGIGGLGKTTLADLVYNDENLVRHFELRMWVCVSDVFDVKIIAKNIIESATKKKCKITQMKDIIDKLKKEIEGKKYLLVLDDVWNEERNKWLDLKQLLMDGAKGSKILVTTRIPVVAKVMDTVSPYNLKGLSEIDSWSLFKQIAFENGVEPKNTNHVAMGKKIVKKCVQVPLAIQTIGALLYSRETEKEWQDFLDNKLSNIAPTESGIFPILKLSYDHLQPHLKKCFAFCSVFPKDYRIETRTLIQLWVAQGFVQLSDNSQRVEEVGEQYFKDLLSRSFFQDVETNEFTGDAVSCKMHDLVHDFAQLIVGNEICIINSDAKEVDARTRHVFVDSDQESLGEIPARLLEASKLRTLLFSERWGTRAQSEIRGMSESTCNKTISSFKRVRVLGLQYREIQRVPNSIGKLRLVRNLDLSGNLFESLPECICGLLTLESLNLSTCMFLKTLPRQIKKLVRLRHLDTHYCFNLKYMPPGLGQLTSLERLSWFVLIPPIFYELNLASGLSELQRLVNIRGELKIMELIGCTLEIRKESGSSYYLSGMKFLDSLGLWWSQDEDVIKWSQDGDENYNDQLTLFESLRPHSNLKELEIRFYAGVDFPSWMTVDVVLFLPNLAHITLGDCGKCQNLPPFGLLPSLRVLELDFLQSLEYIYEEEEEEEGKNCGDFASSSSSLKAQQLFPSLKKLILSRLKQLKGLGSRRRRTRGREEGVTTASSSAAEILFSCSNRVTQHFPSLVELKITDCPLLDFSADDDENSRQFQTLGTLTSLQEIYIDDCGSMTSLPDSMRQLTELKHLNVRKCPQLIPRCKKETGEDWPKIAHIPYIDCKVPEPEEYESSVVGSFNTEVDGY